MPKVSIVIPSFNGLEYLPDCLEALSRQTEKDFEIIVVDNGSTDQTQDYLKKNHPKVVQIPLNENKGFAGACNEGVKQAKGNWIVFLNNDTEVANDWLGQLLGPLEQDPSVGVTASKPRVQSDRARLDAMGSYLTASGFLRHVGILEIDHGQHDQLGDIFSPKGVAFAIEKDLLDRLGGFDERFVSYFEESDLFWRVWLAGRSVRVVPTSVVYHKIGGTACHFQYAWVDYHSFKNRIRSILKNAGFLTLSWMLSLHLICCLGLCLVNLLHPKRWANAGAIAKGILWNLWVFPETWRQRLKVQGSRKVSDRLLFKRVLRPIPFGEFAQYVKWMVWSREQMREQTHSGNLIF